MPNSLMIKSIRVYFSVMSTILPKRATKMAYKLFHKPRPYSIRASEQKLLDRAQKFKIPIDNQTILQAYRWGNEDAPAILLVHGWSVHSVVMGYYIMSLVRQGYQVISYDAIGHGNSTGELSDLANWSHSLNVVMDAIGEVECIIAHSLGGAAVIIASNLGLKTKKIALLAPMSNAFSVTDNVGYHLGIPRKIMKHMRDYTWKRNRQKLARFGTDWHNVFISDFHVPTLIIHDKDDTITSLEESKTLLKSWPWAKLIETKGLGHKKILYNRTALQQVMDFIKE